MIRNDTMTSLHVINLVVIVTPSTGYKQYNNTIIIVLHSVEKTQSNSK